MSPIKVKCFIVIALTFINATTMAASMSVYSELDQNFKQSESQKEKIIPKGNGPQTQIPKVAQLRIYSRAALSGEWLALLNAGNETEFALTIGKNKIPKILDSLNKQGLLAETIKLARAFKIHPLHILGPIIGENSFNGSIDQTLQDSFAKMFTTNDFQIMSSRMKMIVDDPQTQGCLELATANYWKWRCLLHNSVYLKSGSNRDFIWWFYQISNKGQGTFGLGQMQPFLLWSVSDLVREKTKPLGYKYRAYSLTDLKTPFEIIFNNKEMLAYIAATAYVSINVYKTVAHIDISQNPGLTTTLYNVGDEYQRAYMLNLRDNEGPKVNYMGWYINYFEKTIENYLKTKTLKIIN